MELTKYTDVPFTTGPCDEQANSQSTNRYIIIIIIIIIIIKQENNEWRIVKD